MTSSGVTARSNRYSPALRLRPCPLHQTAAPNASTTTRVTRARILRTTIEVVLQDDCRRGRIQPCLTRTPVLLRQRETALGLAAREPLVLKCDRKCGFRSQPSRELLHARRHL